MYRNCRHLSVVNSCFPRSWFSADISATGIREECRQFFGSRFLGSHPPTLIFLAPKPPTNSQAPRASVAPNYQFPKRSQLVAQIPDYRLLPTGNQNHWCSIAYRSRALHRSRHRSRHSNSGWSLRSLRRRWSSRSSRSLRWSSRWSLRDNPRAGTTGRARRVYAYYTRVQVFRRRGDPDTYAQVDPDLRLR